MPLQPQLLFFAATKWRRLKHDGTRKFLAHNFQVTKTKHAIVKRRCEAPGDANPQLISYAKPRCWEIWKTGQSAWKWIAPPTAGWQLKNEALERARKATPTYERRRALCVVSLVKIPKSATSIFHWDAGGYTHKTTLLLLCVCVCIYIFTALFAVRLRFPHCTRALSLFSCTSVCAALRIISIQP